MWNSSSIVVLEVVIMTTYMATRDDKVGILTNPGAPFTNVD